MAQIEKRIRADGDESYRVKWVIGGGRPIRGASEGDRGSQASETFTSKAKAESFREDVETAGHMWPKGWVKGQGYPHQVSTSVTTFADVAEKYFDFMYSRRVARGKVQADTVDKYRGVYQNHLKPVFGNLSFVEVTIEDIESWVDDEWQAGEGWAAKSVHNWHGVLHSIMSHGQARMRLRPDNPCLASAEELPPVASQRDFLFFTHPEWKTMRSLLKSDVHLLVDTLLHTAMRWGECTAVRASDCIIKDNGDVIISVKRAWKARGASDKSPIRADQFESKKWRLGSPKNGKTRTVVATGDVGRRLATLIRNLTPEAYLFARDGKGATGCPWRYNDFHYERWRPAREAAKKRGIEKKLTPHMLRHTFAVWALARGLRLEDISIRMGHGSITITHDRYGGLLDPTDNRVASVMAEMMDEPFIISEAPGG